MSEFDNNLPIPDDEPGLTQPEGYLLSGEALRGVTLEEIRAKLGELGLEPEIEVTPVADLSVFQTIAEQGEDEPEPVPMTRADFRRFAAEHGYTSGRAHWSWNSVMYTADSPMKPYYTEHAYPPIRWADKERDAVDLRSIYERLAASVKHPSDAWVRHTPDNMRFLTHMVNELVQPNKPLEIKNRRSRGE